MKLELLIYYYFYFIQPSMRSKINDYTNFKQRHMEYKTLARNIRLFLIGQNT